MATLPAWPSLSNGDTCINVKALQSLLNYQNGNTALGVDGIFGPKLKTAVSAFQTKNGLSATGTANSSVLTKLIVDLKSGDSKKSAIIAAQHLLGKFEIIEKDGVFGSDMQTIVKAFQNTMGISATGTINATTWRYLFGYDAHPDYKPFTDQFENYCGDTILSKFELMRLNESIVFYRRAAKGYQVPWQLLAAIHYRENRFGQDGPTNKHGPYQISDGTWKVGDYTAKEFLVATNKAATFIKEKAANYNIGLTSTADVKRLFFLYNGAADVYVKQGKALGFTAAEAARGEGSPYVMNRYDKKRDPTVEPTKSNKTWGQIPKDNGSIAYPANTDFGAYTLYVHL